VEPAIAVVSIVTPDAPTTVRVSFCNQVHFFAGVGAGVGADAAKGWLAGWLAGWLDQHPGAGVLSPTPTASNAPPIEQIHSGTAETSCC
jgi:alkylmercury lyase